MVTQTKVSITADGHSRVRQVWNLTEAVFPPKAGVTMNTHLVVSTHSGAHKFSLTSHSPLVSLSQGQCDQRIHAQAEREDQFLLTPALMMVSFPWDMATLYLIPVRYFLCATSLHFPYTDACGCR